MRIDALSKTGAKGFTLIEMIGVLAMIAILDGASLSASDAASADLRGRVKYAAITNGLTTVYIYVTHR